MHVTKNYFLDKRHSTRETDERETGNGLESERGACGGNTWTQRDCP